nr:MAG TPA: hypothetical protein [Caudoviricetes sp.]
MRLRTKERGSGFYQPGPLFCHQSSRGRFCEWHDMKNNYFLDLCHKCAKIKFYTFSCLFII